MNICLYTVHGYSYVRFYMPICIYNHPFLTLFSPSIHTYIHTLDYMEGRGVHSFAKSAQGLKESLEEAQDVAVRSVEEMTELKELSR
jgi:hypothetical protein